MLLIVCKWAINSPIKGAGAGCEVADKWVYNFIGISNKCQSMAMNALDCLLKLTGDLLDTITADWLIDDSLVLAAKLIIFTTKIHFANAS